eukprot:scaffold4217_cov27-Tisochrysis_lutea.AAC.1
MQVGHRDRHERSHHGPQLFYQQPLERYAMRMEARGCICVASGMAHTAEHTTRLPSEWGGHDTLAPVRCIATDLPRDDRENCTCPVRFLSLSCVPA